MKLVASKLTAIAIAIAGAIASAPTAQAADDVVIVYDASGSMWGQIDGTSKMEIARNVLADLVNDWDSEINLGLVAYGHRSKGDCTDIETMIAPAPVDRDSFIDTVNTIRPVGKTPISASVQHAADLLSYRDNPATVVLISDGVETCNADPCALSAQLAKQGVKFTAHVVGFDLDHAAQAGLSCIAENTGGMFVPAGNADELHDALTQVQSAMEVQPVEPEPVKQQVNVSTPEQATTGATFDIAWDKTVNGDDFITIVPAGSDEGTRNNHIRARDDLSSKLTAPSEPGLYEVRYVLNQGKKTIGVASVEVVEASVTVTAPEKAITGAAFDIAWDKTVNGDDFITIVPAGSDEGTRNNHIRARDDLSSKLTAPSEPGLYEVRYVLNQGKKTIGVASVEVVEAEMGISGPGIVRAGTQVDIAWSSSINISDFVTIVPAGADEGTRHTHLRVGDKTEGRLQAPAETGFYEIRYVLEQGKKTLATAPLEVVGADAPLDGGAGLSVPQTAATGETITVTWTGGNNDTDQRIAIARKDQPDFSWLSAQKIKTVKSMELKMPDERGLYEVRFLDISERKLLGRSVVEVK